MVVVDSANFQQPRDDRKRKASLLHPPKTPPAWHTNPGRRLGQSLLFPFASVSLLSPAFQQHPPSRQPPTQHLLSDRPTALATLSSIHQGARRGVRASAQPHLLKKCSQKKYYYAHRSFSIPMSAGTLQGPPRPAVAINRGGGWRGMVG